MSQVTAFQKDVVFVDEHYMAKVLKVSVKTLRNWRFTGKVSLPYRKFGGSVRYAIDEVLAWAEAQRRTSTSEGVTR